MFHFFFVEKCSAILELPLCHLLFFILLVFYLQNKLMEKTIQVLFVLKFVQLIYITAI